MINLIFFRKVIAVDPEDANRQISLEFEEPPEQVQPTYIEQVELHPSPLILFPSSQASTNFPPSPHCSEQFVSNN